MKGIAVSKGIVIAKVYKYEQPQIKLKEVQGDIDDELAIFENALTKTISDIEMIKTSAKNRLSDHELAIFDAHLTMASDPDFKIHVEDLIKNGMNADLAIKTVVDQMILYFETMEDEYFKERVSDINDVAFRLLCNISGLIIPDLGSINEEVIVVAHDLTPSDTSTLNKDYVLGFATNIGGQTSHSAIMARTLEIPAVVGTKDVLNHVQNGDIMILDALNGEIIINPDEKTISEYQMIADQYHTEREELKALINEPSITRDGILLDIAGNIGTPNDLEAVLEVNGDSVGLYRTEFLYMNSTDDFPSEDEQFEAYKEVLEKMRGKRVVVRTLDIGGDKKLNYFHFSKELNPFLGYRAIRLCLDNQDIFRVQLRALIRASAYGKLAIMFPMIATVQEFKDAKAIFEEERAHLLCEGVPFSDDIEVGMMVEIPSAALLAEQFAKYVDFFSIGTNDLIQYTLAADRTSPTVSYLYQPLNPAVLRLVKMAIDGAHKYGKWCGCCGEMASDSLVVPVLVGLGLDEFSISADSILNVRKTIKDLARNEMEELANEALKQDTEAQVRELVEHRLGLGQYHLHN